MTEEENEVKDMSAYKVEVFKVDRISKHPNADKLEIMTVHSCYKCVVGKGQFKVGDLAAYVTPESKVKPLVPEFAFLAPHPSDPNRTREEVVVKVKCLRGEYSEGLVIKARPHWKEGDNVAAELMVEHYQPPTEYKASKSNNEQLSNKKLGHLNYARKYDIESGKKYWAQWTKLLRDHPGKFSFLITESEKIHGMNMKIGFSNGQIIGGTRTRWLSPDPIPEIFRGVRNLFPTFTKKGPGDKRWWKFIPYKPTGAVYDIIEENREDLEKFFSLEHNKKLVIYGELFGPGIQKLTYGKEKPTFTIFDIFDMDQDRYLSSLELLEAINSFDTPKLYSLIVSMFTSAAASEEEMDVLLKDLLESIEEDSQVSRTPQLKEGSVVEISIFDNDVMDTFDAEDFKLERKLKFVSNRYYES